MSGTATEARHGEAEGLDRRPPRKILSLLASGQQAAAAAVDAAIPSIEAGSDRMAQALRSGGKLVYAGAGSSGLMAMADALELPGTYGIPKDRILVLLAGGVASLGDLAGSPEDDVEQARRDAAVVEASDCVLCVSASGSTPYAVAVAQAARERGAQVVGIANNPGAALFSHADVSILLQTPPEVIAGSTRMGAGTAQKIAFNMLSTLAAIRLGHVHDGHMVNLHPDNIKLKARATRMVADIAGVAEEEAKRLLAMAEGSVKVAVLLAAGTPSAGDARRILHQNDDVLRSALAAFQDINGFHKRA